MLVKLVNNSKLTFLMKASLIKWITTLNAFAGILYKGQLMTQTTVSL